MVIKTTALAKKKKPTAKTLGGLRQMAAGEFKAKCLGVLDEVQETGRHVVVTKRGKPVAKVVPIANGKKKANFFGRLEGIIEIVGDPDDLVKPVFPLEDWDMLR